MNHRPLETKSSAKADATQKKWFETFNFGQFVLIKPRAYWGNLCDPEDQELQ
jgi:hypothetical protein